ncbi:phospholipase D-like domain-containing protein [Streptomyces hirsutus]|uniref:phospholipase D n=1 Tax=Streptomyces hirsutus TaxID=35620 RepID=A0ABZ1GVM6_9ACTN|nr:phospholipase D-like domain-containing protein [Streptomyces hirsutus]WSD10261.1 phospholipase D-like domain-containing protein [Streptomyces hirsutus]
MADDTVPLTTTFNDPVGTTAQQDAIRDQLLSLINRAPEGSIIYGSIYKITDSKVKDALLAADQRGVLVKLIVDDDTVDISGSQYRALADGLSTDLPAKRSWVLACPKGRGCIGNRAIGTGHAIDHNKFFLFSKVGSTENVIFQASANLTTAQRQTFYNNAVTIPDNGSGLFATYLAYFQDLKKYGSNGGNGLSTYYKTQQSGPYKTYFMPRQESSGTTYSTDASTDTIVSLLGNVDCAGGATQIRIGMYAFTRSQIADKLVELKKAGCRVELVRNAEDGNYGTKVQGILAGKLTSLMRCDGTAQNADGTQRIIGIHSKYMLIEGTYLGTADRKLVFTGSHNYTYPSLRAYDETLLKIDNAAFYNSFKANFTNMQKSPYCTKE